MNLTGTVTEMMKATGVQFSRRAPGTTNEWHTGPRRQFVITLSGRGELEVAGGKKVAAGPGHINLIEDTTPEPTFQWLDNGSGHSRSGSPPWRAILRRFPEVPGSRQPAASWETSRHSSSQAADSLSSSALPPCHRAGDRL